MSREHVMPQWMRKLFPDLTEVDYMRAFQTSEGESTEHQRPGRPFDQTVRDFCAACNNGWMSQLEQDAEPLLTPMIGDQPLRLEAVEQMTVATWATKTVLTAGPTNLGPEPFASTEMYRWFGENQAPLPGSVVWIGRYGGEGQWPVSFHLHGMAFGPADETGRPLELLTGFHAVMAIGSLVLCVFMIESPMPLVSGGSDPYRALIWPATGDPVWWPPELTFMTTDDLMAASRVAPGGPAIPLPPA